MCPRVQILDHYYTQCTITMLLKHYMSPNNFQCDRYRHCHTLQTALNKLQDLCTNNNLPLSDLRCNVMSFSLETDIIKCNLVKTNTSKILGLNLIRNFPLIHVLTMFLKQHLIRIRYLYYSTI